MQGSMDPVNVVDLLTLAGNGEEMTVWTHETEDLNVNLLVLAPGHGVAEHRNAHVDVLLVGVQGAGYVAIDETEHSLGAGQALVIPKGTRRSIASGDERFAYLTCHRRRGRLWPEPLSRLDDDTRQEPPPGSHAG